MSTHKKIRNLLYEYARDELGTEERSAVESHVATCSQCQGELREFRSAFELMPPDSVRPAEQRPPEFWQTFASRIEARVRQEQQNRRKPGPSLWESLEATIMLRPRFAAAAAGALALLGVAVLTWHLLVTSVAPEVQQPQIVQSASVEPTDQLNQYFRRSKMLLVGITNRKEPEGVPVDLSTERRVSRQLLAETKSLRLQPLDGPSVMLVDNLEKVFNELANAKQDADLHNVELVRNTIRQENLLFKIRMAEAMHGGKIQTVREAE